MRLMRNLVFSGEILAAHRLRTLLSVTGIVVGVAAVILMVAVGRGAEERILGPIRAMGTNLILVSAGQFQLIAGRQRQMSMVKTLIPSDAQAIAKECPSVLAAAPAIGKKLSVRGETENTVANTAVVGMSAEGFAIRNITVATGRVFDPQEGRAAQRVAILGPTAARNLFGEANPIGLQVRVGRVPFEIIGVAAPKGMDPSGADQDDLILVPIETAMRRLFNVTYIQTIYIQARSAEVVDRAEKEIVALLRQRHRLGVKNDDFTVQNQATLLETERETTRSLTWLIGSVAAISLLVGGVGILAVMLMSVRERTREIGLRRAVGARRRDIRTQFLFESALLAGIGGVLGVVGGVGAALGVPWLGCWQTILSWPAATLAFGFSVSLGIVFGSYPAARAARLEPIEALRAE